jgi:hypothetical protein
LVSASCIDRRICNVLIWAHDIQTPYLSTQNKHLLTPLKPNGRPNYMSHLLQQSTNLYFVFMDFV